jgi:exopolyphosphatase/guanosine-5'-triphosphate,3'-diphosphate pyrophosphatase
MIVWYTAKSTIFGCLKLTDLAAAIDLGSNSFHVTIVDVSEDPYRITTRVGEKVQLAAGLDQYSVLSQEAIDRGLKCVRRLAIKLANVPPKHRYVVATNTLRVAHNRDDFVTKAQAILGVPINVLSGDEEASLIFAGVVGDVAAKTRPQCTKLVIDIGGGSTEMILGQNSPQHLRSFPMGCVGFSNDYFPKRKINQLHIQNAVKAAQKMITTSCLSLSRSPEAMWEGWQVCIGSSGTIKALSALSALEERGMPYLDKASMEKIEQQLLGFDHLDEVSIEGLRADRGEVLPAGYAILKGIMLSLKLDRVYFSTGALREGVLLRELQSKVVK